MGEQKFAMKLVAEACEKAMVTTGGCADVQDILLTVMHESVAQIKRLVANVRTGIEYLSSKAPQLAKSERWVAMVRFIVSRILAAQPESRLVPVALPSGSLRNPG